MRIVLDASFAAAWLLPEEHSSVAEETIRRMADPSPVPPLFWDEARNILLMAERRGRIAAGEAVAAMGRLRRLPLTTPQTIRDEEILRLASVHGLSAYDAAYLDVALATQYPIATLDKALAAAARSSAVKVLGPYA